MGFGTAQRFGFAGLVIGFLLCLAGTAAPFWQTGEVTPNTLASWFSINSIPFFGNAAVLKYYSGIWWYCLEYLGKTECRTFKDSEDDSTKFWVCRIGSVVCVVLSLLCALVGLCRTCCDAGSKTIGHGITAFIAGAAGVVTIALFASTTSEDKNLTAQFLNLKYDWAFFVFIAGTAIIVITSFLLCFAQPDNQVGHVISTHGAPPNAIVVTSSSQQAQSFGGMQQPNPYLVNGWQQQQPVHYQHPNKSFSDEPHSKPPGWA